MSECPYCGREYLTVTGMFTHALEDHRDAVLSRWVDVHGFTPLPSGQQRLQEAVA